MEITKQLEQARALGHDFVTGPVEINRDEAGNAVGLFCVCYVLEGGRWEGFVSEVSSRVR